MSKRSLSNKKFDSIKQDNAFRDVAFSNIIYRKRTCKGTIRKGIQWNIVKYD